MDIFQKIKSIRLEKKLSQNDVAKVIGITQTAYAKIENPANPDSRKISIEYGKAIAKALEVPFSELFEIEPPNNNQIDKLEAENEQLKQKISELEELLNDKRRIIQFYENNGALPSVAASILNKENPERRLNRKYDMDSLLKEIEEMPYDVANLKSMKDYIEKRIKKEEKS